MSQSDTLPSGSVLNTYRAPRDFLDCYSVSLKGRPDLQEADMRLLANHILNADIRWMRALLMLRDRVTGLIGMKTTDKLAREQSQLPLDQRVPGDRLNFFRIYRIDTNEILLGEDDWHQDFRVSVYRETGAAPRVFASTCCKRHNLAGHAYLALILPFHKLIARSVLDKAVASELLPARHSAGA